jgi:heme O synthase-like polyprenyltransferase
MVRIIINIVLVIALVLVTWFGLGPVFFADGTSTEKTYALFTVSFLYLLLFAIMYYVNRHIRNKKGSH